MRVRECMWEQPWMQDTGWLWDTKGQLSSPPTRASAELSPKFLTGLVSGQAAVSRARCLSQRVAFDFQRRRLVHEPCLWARPPPRQTGPFGLLTGL